MPRTRAPPTHQVLAFRFEQVQVIAALPTQRRIPQRGGAPQGLIGVLVKHLVDAVTALVPGARCGQCWRRHAIDQRLVQQDGEHLQRGVRHLCRRAPCEPILEHGELAERAPLGIGEEAPGVLEHGAQAGMAPWARPVGG